MNSNNTRVPGKKSKTSELIIAETADQIAELLKVSSGEAAWIATGPGAMATLDQTGGDYHTIDDFCRADEVIAAYKASRSMTEKLCDLSDGIIWESFPELAKRQIKPFLFSFFQWALHFDYLFRRTAEINCILEQLKPSRVLIADKDDYVLASQVAKSSSSQFDGELVKIDGNWDDDPRGGKLPISKWLRQSAKQFIESRQLLNSIQKNVASAGIKNIPHVVSEQLKSGDTVAILGAAYEWGYCRGLLAEKCLRVIDIAPRRFKAKGLNADKANAVVGTVLKAAGREALFNFEGIDLSPVLAPLIQRLMPETTAKCLRAAENAERLLRKNKVRAVLMATCVSPEAHCYTAAARNLGIPVLSCQHGGGGFFEHLVGPYMDILPADRYLVSGAGTASTYAKWGDHFNCQVIPTGSPSFDDLVRKANDQPSTRGKKRILYGTSHYLQHNNYFAVGTFYSDIEFYRSQKSLLSGLARTGDLEIVIKLHPGLIFDDPPWVSDQHPANFKLIKRERTFSELAKEADAVLIDRASTVLMQAIALHKPVFLLQDEDDFFVRDSLELLKRRVVCSRDPEELTEAIKTYLATGKYRADLDDRAFLKEYGTYLDDGKSAERMVAEVLKSIEKPV